MAAMLVLSAGAVVSDGNLSGEEALGPVRTQ